MATVEVENNLFRLFARLLEYPEPGLDGSAGECAALLAQVTPAAGPRVERFRRFVAESEHGRVEEVYTSTFDLQPVCSPYVGYHLFGESYERGAFMVKLKGEYRRFGFTCGAELPDHLAVMLRFLAGAPDEALRRALLAECLAPAVAKMVACFAGSANPYGEVVRALGAFIPLPAAEPEAEVGTAPAQKPAGR